MYYISSITMFKPKQITKIEEPEKLKFITHETFWANYTFNRNIFVKYTDTCILKMLGAR